MRAHISPRHCCEFPFLTDSPCRSMTTADEFPSGCWLSDPLNRRFGRRGTIFLAALVCLVTVFGSAFAQSWQELLICRLLLEIGMGGKASTVPIFAAESAPARIRGALVMSWQLWVAFGILLYVSRFAKAPKLAEDIFLLISQRLFCELGAI
jgi:MFS family permease